MGAVFSAGEAVRVSIQIEKNGGEFYAAAAAASSGETAHIFQYLSEEEEGHARAFEEMLRDLEEYEPSENYPGEYSRYLADFSRRHVFPSQTTAAPDKDDREAVEFALGLEHDSIAFYTWMKQFVPVSAGSVLEKIIEQEQGHIGRLSELKRALEG